MSAKPLLALALALLAPDTAHAIGLLVPSDGQGAVALVSHRVAVEITERAATTRVTQEFENRSGRPLEATYLFPLPKGAVVDEFALWMNGERQVGKVLERGQARAIYESIVRRAQDPGLIEYVGAELFQARVFPVPATGRQKVELVYHHVVDYEGGTHRYVYPMKTDQRAAETLRDFTFTAKLSGKLPIRNVYSPTHSLAIQKREQSAVASFERNGFSLADDLSLYWSVDDADVGLTLLSYKEGEEPGYYLLLASPRDGFREREIIGKRVTFVVDVSGSMAGDKMRAARQAIDHCLSRLGDDDLFNVVAFGGFVESYAKGMVSASPDNVAKARAFVRSLEPAGGTAIEEALLTALSSATGSKRAPHMVVFLTDGQPTVGETDPRQILARVAQANGDAARIFVFGVGDDVNTVLLDELALGTRATSSYLKADMSLEAEVKAFYDRLSHPVLSDLTLDLGTARSFGQLPGRLPDLFKGDQLLLVGRYRQPGPVDIELSGQTPSGRKSFRYSASLAQADTEHRFIPRLWAQRQVAALLSQIRARGESAALVREVTDLATKYGIVTPYTSYLVVEPAAPPPAPERPADLDRRAGAPPREPAAAAPVMLAPPRSMTAEAGEDAVALSKELGRMRQATRADDGKRLAVVRALGRTFRREGSLLVDERAAPGDQVLQLAPFSAAYFLALELRPELKEAFALGAELKINVARGRSLLIRAGGREQVERGELASFVKP